MGKNYIFKIGGGLFVASGALGLFFWILSILGQFESVIPAAKALSGLGGLEMLKSIIILVGSILVSVGFVLAGLVFIKIPSAISGGDFNEVNEKVNRLQTVVWKLLQKVKQEKSVEG
ncbi:MAG: hypothetical protein ABIG20_02180 [archaeon]